MAGWGAFEPGCQETVHFDTDSLPRVAFEMEAEAAFRAAYRWQAFGQEPTGDVLTSRICIERRACRFGGSRAYFICPYCLRHTLRLAVLPEGLRCGTCGRVTWGSRREGKTRRLIRKANKLARRIGSEDWDQRPGRPPAHMRLTTFARIEAERSALTDEINAKIAPGVLRRLATISRRLEGADE